MLPPWMADDQAVEWLQQRWWNLPVHVLAQPRRKTKWCKKKKKRRGQEDNGDDEKHSKNLKFLSVFDSSNQTLEKRALGEARSNEKHIRQC